MPHSLASTSSTAPFLHNATAVFAQVEPATTFWRESSSSGSAGNTGIAVETPAWSRFLSRLSPRRAHCIVPDIDGQRPARPLTSLSSLPPPQLLASTWTRSLQLLELSPKPLDQSSSINLMPNRTRPVPARMKRCWKDPHAETRDFAVWSSPPLRIPTV